MLFLSEAIYEARRQLLEELDGGKVIEEKGFEKMLDLYPYDDVALRELARLRSEAGDQEKAEELYWRAIEAQPTRWHGYMDLARLLNQQTGQQQLSLALAELGVSKLLLDSEALEEMDPAPLPGDEDEPEFVKNLSGPEQMRLAAESARHDRDREPVEVTSRLRPHRLVHDLLETEDPDEELIDALVEEGEAAVPLLAGVLRGWAQDYLAEDYAPAVENTLAILGEIGAANAIPDLLEFIVRDDIDLAGAAGWAFDRIALRNPEETASVISQIASALEGPERIAIAERLLRFRKLDSTGKLFVSLGENLGRVSKEDREPFFPLLLTSLIASRGPAGVDTARMLLRRNMSLLSRKTRRECEELLEVLGSGPLPPPPPDQPSRWTVYDICAGDVSWEEEEERLEAEDFEDEFDDEEPDLFSVAPPRKPSPGRNDLCWCGSGKKYKKCHLEADRKGDAATPAPGHEFDTVRNQIGRLLEELLPSSKNRAIVQEFFGDQASSGDELAFIDWAVHDWVVPRLGRTVLEEFLVRMGSTLTLKEREFVESSARSFVALYEVQNTDPGRGASLSNLMTNEVVFIHDTSLSNRLVRWDGILTRVIQAERGTEVTGVALSVPRVQLDPFRKWLEAERRRSGISWPEYFKANWPVVRRGLWDIVEDWRESIRLTNSDGDDFLWSKAVYRIVQRPALLSALKERAELNEDEEGKHYLWLSGSPGDPDRIVEGHIRLEGEQLFFECNSKARLESGRELLAGVAGSAIKHVRDEFTSQQELKRRAAQQPRAQKSEIPTEVQSGMITEILEMHYSKWPDMALPALRGKTPREAVQTEPGKRKVIALLRDIENGEEHKRRNGEPSYDVGRLRRELGLTENS